MSSQQLRCAPAAQQPRRAAELRAVVRCCSVHVRGQRLGQQQVRSAVPQDGNAIANVHRGLAVRVGMVLNGTGQCKRRGRAIRGRRRRHTRAGREQVNPPQTCCGRNARQRLGIQRFRCSRRHVARRARGRCTTKPCAMREHATGDADMRHVVVVVVVVGDTFCVRDTFVEDLARAAMTLPAAPREQNATQ